MLKTSKDILVIGDSCRDIFIYCNATRMCPDVPVPILTCVDIQENMGMAKNVQRNIMTSIPHCDIITNNNWYDITKTRYVHASTNHMFFRIDSPESIDRINLEDIDYNYKMIIISDYDKGFLSIEDIMTILSKHNNVFIDTKKILGEWCENATYIKINHPEYLKSMPYICEKLKNKIIHTMGDKGCEFKNKRYNVKKVDIKDISGAGDSFLAALAISFLKSNNIERSIKFANAKASEVVKYRGVSII